MSTAIVHPDPISEIRPYTRSDEESLTSMAAKRPRKPEDDEPFGQRMARLRKLAGYSQRSLAAELGISYRMVAYYESQTEHIPAHLLPHLADALGITVDQLLGREAVSPRRKPENQQLLRKLRRVEMLPPRARTAVIEHIEALLAKHRESA
jgi:transcriptional regulator with XRE-family HTH domain